MLTRVTAMLPINPRGMWIGTFHGLANRMLRTHHREVGLPPTLHHPRLAGPAGRDQADAQGGERRRGPLPAARAHVLHQRPEGRGHPAGAKCASPTRPPRATQISMRAYEEQCQREGVVDFAELLLRAYELLARNEILREHYSQRFRHILVDEFQDTNRLQYRWLKLIAGRASLHLRGRRRRPVDLHLPRRERRQHGRLRARLQGEARGAPRAELPLARQHPRCRERAHLQQPQPPRQESLDRRRQGRAAARVRGPVGQRRSALDGGGGAVARARRHPPLAHRHPVPLERAVARGRARALFAGHPVPGLRRPALLRARGDQARACVPAPRRGARRRQRVPAGGELPDARHRRPDARAAAGRREARLPFP